LLKREQIYLQSKFTPLSGQDPLQIPYDPDASLSDQVIQSFDCSLKNLQTDYLDGLVLHSPLSDKKQLLQVWRAMETIAGRGAVRQLGISNCYEPELFEYLYDQAILKPAVLQNRFYADTGYDKNLRTFCRQHGVIYQSFWTLTANPQIVEAQLIEHLAGKYQRTPAQIWFRYLTQIGIVPLTGTTSVAHMRQDLAIFQFTLAAGDCAEIEQLF
ncbi:MAG: aldo/keto reductase, partial [Methylomonas sp.]|nr:aldo/keto reductase [Methylomonas sp.]